MKCGARENGAHIIKKDTDIEKYHFQRIWGFAIFNPLPNKPPILFEPEPPSSPTDRGFFLSFFLSLSVFGIGRYGSKVVLILELLGPGMAGTERVRLYEIQM